MQEKRNQARNLNIKNTHFDQLIFYAGKFRKFAVKTKCTNENRVKKYVGSCPDIDCEDLRDSIETRIWMLEEFRRVHVTKPPLRADMMAMKEMKRKYRCFEPSKIEGPIPAVKIGDEFYLRVELKIVGLHLQLIHGIDYTETCPGRELIATSVVATEGYDDDLNGNIVLYKGEGGNFGSGGKKGKMVKDQVLENGNLALDNSMKRKKEVRVIRGIQSGSKKKTVFVYDGLYMVVSRKEICGACGYKQFEFKLCRCPNQERINWSRYK